MGHPNEPKARPKSALDFRLMSLTYRFRDLVRPRFNILKEVGIREGNQVLDYGCGPGSYILPLAELVGESGSVYALDVHPLATRSVQKIAKKEGVTNIRTILSDCETGLPSDSLDVILLYDILHDLDYPNRILSELNRVLKAEGILSVSDHHLAENDLILRVTDTRLFRLSRKGDSTLSFVKEGT